MPTVYDANGNKVWEHKITAGPFGNIDKEGWKVEGRVVRVFSKDDDGREWGTLETYIMRDGEKVVP